MATTQASRAKAKRPKPKPQPRVYADDGVFFHKGQVRIGTLLVYKGRSAPGSRWRVIRIVSYEKGGKNRPKPVAAVVVRHLSDAVHVQNQEGTVHMMSFGYMSYSAIWQLSE